MILSFDGLSFISVDFVSTYSRTRQSFFPCTGRINVLCDSKVVLFCFSVPRTGFPSSFHPDIMLSLTAERANGLSWPSATRRPSDEAEADLARPRAFLIQWLAGNPQVTRVLEPEPAA